jgi:hypothetical protein
MMLAYVAHVVAGSIAKPIIKMDVHRIASLLVSARCDLDELWYATRELSHGRLSRNEPQLALTRIRLRHIQLQQFDIISNVIPYHHLYHTSV